MQLAAHPPAQFPEHPSQLDVQPIVHEFPQFPEHPPHPLEPLPPADPPDPVHPPVHPLHPEHVDPQVPTQSPVHAPRHDDLDPVISSFEYLFTTSNKFSLNLFGIGSPFTTPVQDRPEISLITKSGLMMRPPCNA